MLAGVIRNPRSQRNRGRAFVDDDRPESVRIAMPATPQALAHTLQEFAACGIRHLLIDGGDGTLRDVLGALPAAYGEDWPTLSLCASGNTNLAAGDVGSYRRGARMLCHWHQTLTGVRPQRREQRRLIEVRWPDGSHPPVFGFFVGCANYTRAVQMATGTVQSRGLVHGWAVSATILGAAWQILTGAKQSDWQRGSALGLAVDDKASEFAPRFVLLATSLDKLLLGLWPFWSSSPQQGAALHWLDILAPAPRFGRALPALLRGKPRAWMLASGAYRSGVAERLGLSLHEPLIIDGEAFAADANGQLELRLGPEVRFVSPA